MTDLIKRDDALAACDIAPPDEWNDYTKGGYDFAAEECKRNIAALPAVTVGVKPLDLSYVQKHAFLSGVVAARNIPPTEPCIGPSLWVDYDPGDNPAMTRILAALTPVADSQPAVHVVNRQTCTFPQCGCVAKGQWCPVPCTAIRKAALLDAGYDTPAIDPAAIREAALREAMEIAKDWYSDGDPTAIWERIEALIGETK